VLAGAVVDVEVVDITDLGSVVDLLGRVVDVDAVAASVPEVGVGATAVLADDAAQALIESDASITSAVRRGNVSDGPRMVP
jgi:hypothetical protein